jgi:hypothetical protein
MSNPAEQNRLNYFAQGNAQPAVFVAESRLIPISYSSMTSPRHRRGIDTSIWFAFASLVMSCVLVFLEVGFTEMGWLQMEPPQRLVGAGLIGPAIIAIVGTFTAFGTMAFRHVLLRRRTTEKTALALILAGILYATVVAVAWYLTGQLYWLVNTSIGVELLMAILPVVTFAIAIGWRLVKHVKPKGKRKSGLRLGVGEAPEEPLVVSRVRLNPTTFPPSC